MGNEWAFRTRPFGSTYTVVGISDGWEVKDGSCWVQCLADVNGRFWPGMDIRFPVNRLVKRCVVLCGKVNRVWIEIVYAPNARRLGTNMAARTNSNRVTTFKPSSETELRQTFCFSSRLLQPLG